MKKLSLIILSALMLFLCPAVTAHAEGEWVPNPYGLAVVPNAYKYGGSWWTKPPTTPGAVYFYNGQYYTVGGTSTASQTQTTQQTQQTAPTCYQQSAPTYQQSQPAQQLVQPQVVKPYWYGNAWHETAPNTYSTDYWYNGVWYRTVAAPQSTQPAPTPVVQRPSVYVDNTANAKAQELVNYAVSNGVVGSYVDSTDSATVAQKHITFSGQRGSFDMTLTTQVGSDGNYVTKYWRAGIERSLGDIQSWILGCR